MSNLLKYETLLLNRGVRYIAGVDEAGRGPLAGPIVASAVILDVERIIKLLSSDTQSYNFYTQINDSKALTAKTRSSISENLLKECIDYSIVQIESEEIDSTGISRANKKVFELAINSLKVKPDHILTDHFAIPAFNKNIQTNITRGDTLSMTIAAASILAKVFRDTLMVNLHTKYPQYNFAQHKGYGTKEHLFNLVQFGPCAAHRKSFEPVKSLILKTL